MTDTAPTTDAVSVSLGALKSRMADYEYLLYSTRYVRPAQSRALLLERALSVASSERGLLKSRTDQFGLWLGVLQNLPWETEFFGQPMVRIEHLISPRYTSISKDLYEAGIDFVSELVEVASNNGVKHLSCSVDTNDSLIHASLERNGFTIADTICCYLLDCSRYARGERPPQIRQARTEDMPLLYEISSQCFGDRLHNRNRFNSDSWFNQEKVAQMYGLWATRSVEKILADETFVFTDDQGPLGFATAKLPVRDELEHNLKVGKVMLNAVSPAHQGRKIYAGLAATCIQWFVDNGMDFAEIRTQLPNIGIHRVWQKLNSTMVLSYHTFHKTL